MLKKVFITLFFHLIWSQDNPSPLRFMQKPLVGDQVSIDLFRQWDKKNSRVIDPVVFVGSSSIRKWFTAEYFPAIPIINRGFGGSHISDVNYFINETVLKHKLMNDDSLSFLRKYKTALEKSFGNAEELKALLNECSTIGFGKSMGAMRLCLVGKLAGPDLFELMVFLGKDEVLKRVGSILA